jgi:hypothetical protein
METSPSFEKRFKQIYQTISTVYDTLDSLMEDPLFIDGIHGEEELGLDQAMELLEGIMRHFEPKAPKSEANPQFDRESYDAD